MRSSEITLRHVFVSPYRCRDCRARFWVLSRNAYYAAGIVGVVVAVAVLLWHASDFVQLPHGETAAADAPAPRPGDLLKLAEANDPNAELELARRYGTGYGVPKDLHEEVKWLDRAARHGNVEAQYEYGIALRDGHGTVQNYEEARKWMQVAAEGGNGSAQFVLGTMYRTGLGMPIDNVKAYVWLNVAAARGVPGAPAARDAVLPRLTQAELQEAQAEARRLSATFVPKSTLKQ